MSRSAKGHNSESISDSSGIDTLDTVALTLGGDARAVTQARRCKQRATPVGPRRLGDTVH